MEVKPGYKQTEVGLIPEDWKVKPLGSVLNKGRLGGNYPNQDHETSYPLIKMGNIARGYIDLSKVEYVSQGITPLPDDRLRHGDVLFNTRNTLDLVGKVAVWRDELPVAYYNSNLMRLEFDPNEVCSHEYANYTLNSSGGVARLRALATGTTSVAAIYTRDLLKFPFIVPSFPEQHSISGALSDVDALIGVLDRLIAKKRELKQAAMQQLLTGQTRLPGFSGAWEVKRLGEVFSIFAGKSKSAFICVGGQYWVVDMGSVSIDGRLIVSKPTNYEGDFLKVGDLVMPKDDIGGGNIIGKVGYIDADKLYVLGDHVYCLRAQQGDPLFLSYVINAHRTNTALRKKVIGSAQLGLGRKSVEEQEIPFPMPEEQTAIAAVLSDMDAEIAAMEARRDKTRALKQGIMQELLTGRTRLV